MIFPVLTASLICRQRHRAHPCSLQKKCAKCGGRKTQTVSFACSCAVCQAIRAFLLSLVVQCKGFQAFCIYCAADGQGKGKKAGLKQSTAGSKRQAPSAAGATHGPSSKKARPEGGFPPADAEGDRAAPSEAGVPTESDGATAMDTGTDASPEGQPVAAAPPGMPVFCWS